MLKASSLFYAIAISLIIALISSSLILFAYFRVLQFQGALKHDSVIRNVKSGINLLLADSETVPLNKEAEIDLFGDGDDVVTLKRRIWGAFEILVAKASFRGFEHKKIAQTGNNLFGENNVALYLADRNKPLALCGNTLIKGISYLPKAGVKRAYIEGQNFVGTKLIAGETRRSEKKIADVNKEMISVISDYLDKKFTPEDSVVEFNLEEPEPMVSHSFGVKTLLYYSEGPIDISNRSYSGNIIFVSDVGVVISASSKIEDLLVYAPYIKIEAGFNGNLQAYASDSISVGENTTLHYPSVVGLVNTSIADSRPWLTVGDNTEISGAVFIYHQKTSARNTGKLSLGKGSLIKGQVYSNVFTELKGAVHGSVMCAKLILNTPSSVYENHLLNVTIDPSQLSAYFVGINIIGSGAPQETANTGVGAKKVVKWLF